MDRISYLAFRISLDVWRGAYEIRATSDEIRNYV